ncbi:MAG: hypothetical protein ACI4XE_02930 [Acutalibacteraceae bacterium]
MKNGSNKNTIKNVAIFIIVLIIFNVIFFAIPFMHTATFWGAYIFGTIAILAQIGVAALSYINTNTLKKKVYAFPIVRMGIIYLAVQLVISLAFSAVSTFYDKLPGWIIYVVSVIVLGVFTILVLLTDTTRDKILEIEEEEERQTAQIKTFRVNIDSITRGVDDPGLLKTLQKLSDTAKYSDPVSSEPLYPIEAEITEKIDELGNLIQAGDIEEAKTLAEKVIDLFEDRNAQCKMYKTK